MAITNYVVEEFGKGKGHSSHGNGKGKGHLKHQQDAMADGDYTIVVDGIDHQNHTSANQTSAPSTLMDGSTMFTEAREGSITVDSAPGGGEALHLITDTNNGRLRLNNIYDADNQFRLGDLDELSFDYYVDSSSRTDVIPVVRVIIDGDGNLATTADRGELVFEWAYQGFGAVQQDSWQTADLAGGDWVAWQRSNGTNWDQIANMTELSDWTDADGFTPVGGVHFDQNSVVLGWSIALGSGNGSNNAYLDDLTVGSVVMQFGG